MKSKLLDDCYLVRDLRVAAYEATDQTVCDLYIRAAVLEQKVYNNLKKARASERTTRYCLELMAAKDTIH